MKEKIVRGMVIAVMLVGLGGCGKSLAQVKYMGDTTVDVGATVAKNGVGVGLSIYELLKAFWEDSKDNIATVKSAF